MAEKPQPASINNIEFDALISYGRNYEAQAPEYPVEDDRPGLRRSRNLL